MPPSPPSIDSSASPPIAAAATAPDTRATDAEPKVALEVIGPFVAGVHGMVVAPDGTLYFSDSFGKLAAQRRVYALAPPYDGEPRPTPVVGKLPAGLAWDEGTLLVCDAGSDSVTRWNADFQATQAWEVPAPWNVVPGRGDELWVVAFDGRAFALAADGSTRVMFGGLDGPFDLVSDREGVWITEQGKEVGQPGRVTLRGLDGTILREVTYAWDNPEGLARAADGALWVAETQRGELLRIGDERSPRVVAAGLTLPVVVVFAPDGHGLVSTGGTSPKLLRARSPSPQRAGGGDAD